MSKDKLIPLDCDNCGRHVPVYMINPKDSDEFREGNYCKHCAKKLIEEEAFI